MRCLIVDDSPADRERVARRLRQTLPEVTCVEVAGPAAFEAALAQDAYDIVLTDFALGWTTGFEVLRRARERDPNIPVVMVTASGGEDVVAGGIRLGLSDYLLKRDLDRLPMVITESLERARLRRENECMARQLRLSEERYRSISELTSDFAFAFRVSPEGDLTCEWITDAFFRITGYSEEEVGPDPWQRTLHPDDAALAQATWDQLRAGQDAVAELRILNRCGETRWLHVTGRPIHDPAEDRVVRIYGAARNVTGRKQSEVALQREKDKLAQERRLLRTVIDNLPDAIYAMDLDARKTLANRADQHNIGVTEEAEALGKTDDEVFPPEVAADLMRDNLHVLQTGQPVREREERVVDRDGNEHWLLTSKFPLRDDTGQIIGLVGTGRDITELRQAEAERRRLQMEMAAQARRVAQILDTVPQGVLLLDAAGHVLLANPLAEHALTLLDGGAEDRVTHLGKRPLRELLTSPPKGLWHEVHAQTRIFEIIARPVVEEGDSEHWVLVINDVTQQRQVRNELAQHERLAAVGQLAAGIAHDFNNIMAIIILHARMVGRAEALSDRGREQLNVIHQQAEHAAELIQQILDFSRRSLLDRQPLDLLPLVKEQAKLLERTLPETIKIQLTYEPDALLVNADPTRLQQLLVNLAINARDAMPQGGTFEIGLERVQVSPDVPPPVAGMPPGEWVKLALADTGSGIPESILPHVFEPFFTTKPPGQGNGLGLPQVYGIVRQHEGYIDVQTAVGAGTSFTVYLPALPLQRKPAPRPETLLLPHGQGETVLVVEDNAPLRKALVQTLTLWDYRVCEAANGTEALTLLDTADHDVAVILSDVVMPDTGGVVLVRTLRKHGSAIPVILMSGHPHESALDDLKTCDIHAWLTKPPALDQLAQALASALHPPLTDPADL